MIKRFTSREDVFEVAYRISKDSDYAKEYARYERDEERRLELCEKFAKEKGITGSKFAIAGDGSVNIPFNENQKRNIYFFIEDNELNRERFKGSLKKKKFTI
jgi:L-lactate utilization protein LutB